MVKQTSVKAEIDTVPSKNTAMIGHKQYLGGIRWKFQVIGTSHYTRQVVIC